MMNIDTHLRDRISPVDIHVGTRIRMRRTLLGMSQERLGDSLGLTFQQVQKYERGSNRVSASRLFNLARVLNVPIQYFFDDLPPEAAQADRDAGLARKAGFAEGQDSLRPPTTEPSAEADEKLYRRETMEVLRAYYRISDPVRKRVFELIKAMALSEPRSA